MIRKLRIGYEMLSARRGGDNSAVNFWNQPLPASRFDPQCAEKSAANDPAETFDFRGRAVGEKDSATRFGAVAAAVAQLADDAAHQISRGGFGGVGAQREDEIISEHAG